MNRSIPGLIAGLLLAAGCAVYPDDPEPALDEAYYQQTCPDFKCGDNSPLIDGTEFHRLSNIPGIFNDQGLTVVDIISGGTSYTLDVSLDRLLALDNTGTPVLGGLLLVGSAIHLRNEEGTDYYVHIVGATQLSYFVDPQPGDTFWAYQLKWSFEKDLPLSPHDGPPPRDVCPLVAPKDPWGDANVMAIFFRGDLYDSDTKLVTETGGRTGSWFNVACAGSAPAKMHAFRFTGVGSNATHSSTQDQRTAMLKMFAGDYCGTGKEFTVIGKELHWQNLGDWRTLDGLEVDDEAVWTRTGAMCLDVPRMDDEEGDTSWYDEIQVECGDDHPLPRCSGQEWFPDGWKLTNASDGSLSYVRTANPPLP